MEPNWESIRFETDFVDSLPGVDAPDAFASEVSQWTANACHAPATVESAPSPELRAWSGDLATSLQLPEPDDAGRAGAAQVFAGQYASIQGRPYAMRYGGHQFGNWAGQLGDGRVINLGELRDTSGQAHTVQLKGAGPTPYSRGADGRAVLRSSIREFVASEAMFHLGVPTSRALALVTSGLQVERDILYDGHPALEPGAVVTRVAPSFLRLGNFEVHAAYEEQDSLQSLHDYCLQRYFPEMNGDTVGFFEEVCRRTAQTIAQWMSFGFVHAVMNTDNLSILGLTIDYGPFGWVEPLDPAWTPNEVDSSGRYGFGNQPRMAQWNLARLGSALTRLGVPVPDLESALRVFMEAYGDAFCEHMGRRLGLPKERVDLDWLSQLYQWMQQAQCDLNITLRGLAEVIRAPDPELRLKALIRESSYGFPEQIEAAQVAASHWLRSWRERLGQQPYMQTAAAMDAANPVHIARNWMFGDVIASAEQGDWTLFEKMQSRLRDPFLGSYEEALAGKRPSGAEMRIGCGRLTCSS